VAGIVQPSQIAAEPMGPTPRHRMAMPRTGSVTRPVSHQLNDSLGSAARKHLS
jgi:hypothetical protein